MVFSSFLFIFGFLPIFLLSYFLCPKRYRNLAALIFSYGFYAWGAPKIVPVLFLSSVFDYLLVGRLGNSEPKRKSLICAIGVLCNVGLLAYYKYANFFVAQLDLMGFENSNWVAVVLPIGISFFTFQKISYIVDVYRGVSSAADNLFDYLLYVVLFPQLIAGPILRYQDMEKQIRSRDHSMELFLYGSVRFMLGLSKKILLANEMGAVANNVFGLSEQGLSTGYAWLGAICYAFQVYFDFSGYSDMAIGLCAMMGFLIPENFRMPYSSSSITEFWRRWHISLSSWMREYLYIPLGGSRCSRIKTARNLWLVFLISGFWHGASWTFIAWGALHGLLLSIERVAGSFTSFRLPRLLAVFLTWVLLLITWVLFRAKTFSAAYQHLVTQFSFSEAINPPALGFVMHERGTAVFIVCCLIVLVSLSKRIASRVEALQSYPLEKPFACFGFAYAALFISVITLATTAFNPFIYFRF
ncbi:UNVERIFIED_CONTAM: hypothetical protein GTU68_056140 [Idotea baltica]|nr:hypothetical protein [Idotea baltica]